MKKFLLFLLLFVVVPTCIYSQVATTGFHRVSQVIARANTGVTATVVPYASVYITNQSTGALATIYSDPLLSVQIASGMVTADANGNYSYYIPLNYCVHESISSPGQGSFGIDNICVNGEGGGGSGTVSGQAAGVIPLATGPTTIGAQSPLSVTSGNVINSGNYTGPKVISSVNNELNIMAPPYNAQCNLLGSSGLTASAGVTAITVPGATQSIVGQTIIIWGAGSAYRNSFLPVAAQVSVVVGTTVHLVNLATQPVNTTPLGSGLTTAVPNASNTAGQYEIGNDDTVGIQEAYTDAHNFGLTVRFPAPGTNSGGTQYACFTQAIDLSGGKSGSSNLTSRIGDGSVVTYLTGFPGQDIFQWPDGKPIGAGYAELKGLQMRVDDSVDVSCPTQTNCPQVGNGQTTFGRFTGIQVAETPGFNYPAESSIVCTSGSAPYTCTVALSNQLGGAMYPNTPVHFTAFTGTLAPLANTTQVVSVPSTVPVSVNIASMNAGSGYSGTWTCTINGGTPVNTFSTAACSATVNGLTQLLFAITTPGSYTVPPTSLTFSGGTFTPGNVASATLGTYTATNTFQFTTSIAGMSGLSSNTPDTSGQISGSMVVTNAFGLPATNAPLITPGPTVLANAIITTSPDTTFDMLYTTNAPANGGDFINAPNGAIGKVISIPSLSLNATITGLVLAGVGNCPTGGNCVTFTPAYSGSATGLSGTWGFASASGPTGNLPPWYLGNAGEVYISTSALTASGPQGIYKDLNFQKYGPSPARVNPSGAFFIQQGTYFGEFDGITAQNLYYCYVEVPPVIVSNIANYTPDTSQYKHFTCNVVLPWVSYAGNHRSWDGMNFYNTNNPLTLGPMVLPGPKNNAGGWTIDHFYHECWGLNTGTDQVWTGGGYSIVYAALTQCGGATFGPQVIWAAGASVITGGIGGPASPTSATAGLQILGSGNIFQNVGLANNSSNPGAQVNDRGVGNTVTANNNIVKQPIVSNISRCKPGEFDGAAPFTYPGTPFTSICSLILDWGTSTIAGAGANNASWLSNYDATIYALTGTNLVGGYSFNPSGFGGFNLAANGQPFAVGSRVPVGTMNVVTQVATGATGTMTVNVFDMTSSSNLVTCTYTIGTAQAIGLHGYLGSSDPCSLTTTNAEIGHVLQIGIGSAPVGGPLFHSFTALVPVLPASPNLPYSTNGQLGSTAFSFAANQTTAAAWSFPGAGFITPTKITYTVTTPDNSANLYDIGIGNSAGTVICHVGATAGTTFASTASSKTLTITGCPMLSSGNVYYILTTAATATAQLGGVTGNSAFSGAAQGVTTGGALNSTFTVPASTYLTSNTAPLVMLHN